VGGPAGETTEKDRLKNLGNGPPGKNSTKWILIGNKNVRYRGNEKKGKDSQKSRETRKRPAKSSLIFREIRSERGETKEGGTQERKGPKIITTQKRKAQRLSLALCRSLTCYRAYKKKPKDRNGANS